MGSSGARLGNMVRDVVCPREHFLADVNAGKDFLTSLIEWEIKVAAYEKWPVATRSAKRCGWRRARCSEVDASFITLGTETYCRCAESVDT